MDEAQPVEQTDPLLPYPIELHTTTYLKSEAEVNSALKHIVDGVIGFDTEFTKRRPSQEEEVINQVIGEVGGSKKTGILAWQAVEKFIHRDKKFPVDWDNIATCVVQLSKGDDVWLINLREIRGESYPTELDRVLCSDTIIKAGLGMANDVAHFWVDFRVNVRNLVDVGCMARLLLAHKFDSTVYCNLSLEVSAAEILGYKIDKEERLSDWTKPLSSLQKKYAAIDAAVTLRLFEKLEPALEVHRKKHGVTIPKNWYSMNGKYGELMRRYQTRWGEELAWSVKDCYWFANGRFQGYT
ncbi:ribonuclease H-like domain-containing protein [Mycena polygramma]|nr:ribonuclease H-like domain-containing protein [Mycena polygramma]